MRHDVEPLNEGPDPSPDWQLNARALLRRMAGGVAVFGSRNVLLVGLDFFSALLLIRLLVSEDYARLTLALSAGGIASSFLDLGLGPFIATEVARSHGQRRPDQVKRFLLRYSQMNLLAGVGFLVLALLAQWPVRRLLSPLMAWLVLIVGFDLFVTAWRNIVLTTFHGHARFARMGSIDILESAAKLGLIVLLVAAMGAGLPGAIAIYPLATVIALLVVSPGWLKLVRPLRGIAASHDPVFREGLRGPGKWAILAYPLKQVRDALPLWLIKWALGNTGVAVFAVAKKGYDYTALLLSPLEDVLLPLISESIDSDHQAIRQLVYSAGKYALIGANILVVVGLLLSPLMYDVIFKYPAAASIYRVLLFTLPLRALALYQRPMLYALRGQKYLVVVMMFGVATLAVTVGLGSIWLGVIGAAMGLFVNLALTTMLRHWIIRRLMPEFHIVWQDCLRIDEFDRDLFTRLRKKLLSRIA